MSNLEVYKIQLSNLNKRPFSLFFDKDRGIPPDSISERIGEVASLKINSIRELRNNPHEPINILEIGIGSGIIPATILASVKNPNDIHIFGIDKDTYNVTLASDNLKKQIKEYGVDSSVSVWQADWSKSSTWKSLKKNKYDIIIFNPPYLPKGEYVYEGYESVPSWATNTNDKDGLQHYRIVLPKIGSILGNGAGSTIFIRRSSRYLNNSIISARFEGIINSLEFAREPSIQYENVIEQVTPQFKGNWVTLSRLYE